MRDPLVPVTPPTSAVREPEVPDGGYAGIPSTLVLLSRHKPNSAASRGRTRVLGLWQVVPSGIEVPGKALP